MAPSVCLPLALPASSSGAMNSGVPAARPRLSVGGELAADRSVACGRNALPFYCSQLRSTAIHSSAGMQAPGPANPPMLLTLVSKGVRMLAMPAMGPQGMRVAPCSGTWGVHSPAQHGPAGANTSSTPPG